MKHVGDALDRFRGWFERLSDRRDRKVFEPPAPFAADRPRRSDWYSTANDRMTDDGAPPLAGGDATTRRG